MSSEYAPPPGYGDYGQPSTVKNGAAITGLVLGILGLLLCWAVIGLPLAIIGLILSIVGFRRVGRGRATNKGVAVTGLVVNVLALLASAVLTALWIAGAVYIAQNGGTDLWNCILDSNGDQTVVNQCVDTFADQNAA
jgi:hypothetical protein